VIGSDNPILGGGEYSRRGGGGETSCCGLQENRHIEARGTEEKLFGGEGRRGHSIQIVVIR